MSDTKKPTNLEKTITKIGEKLKNLGDKDTDIENRLQVIEGKQNQPIDQSALKEEIAAKVKAAIVGADVDTALDTLKEIGDKIKADGSAGAAMAQEIGKRVRFDAPQVLTPEQQKQAKDNLGITTDDTDYLAELNKALGESV